MKQPDSLIFDMDGTLWNAVDSYATVWNRTLDQLGSPDEHVTYEKLAPLMGLTIETIAQRLLPGGLPQADRFFEVLSENERAMMPELGGKLYPGVADTLRRLKEAGVKLFMVSNCSAAGLPNFVAFNKLEGIFTNLLSLGATGKPKNENMRTLISRYNLQSPAYVGDTRGDQAYTRKAGIPFIWASYGFDPEGVRDADFTLHRFSDLLTLFPQTQAHD